MRLSEAQKWIDKYKDLTGYRVHFEHISDDLVRFDYFPNDLGEPLIASIEQAQVLAGEFARATTSDYVNIYIVDASYIRVDNNWVLRPYPAPAPKTAKTEKPDC